MAVAPRPVVFIVDDEKIICDTLAIIFEQNGYEVRSFFSAEQAILTVSTTSPSMLISEVILIGMSGIELAIQFKTTYPACKVILFSGHLDTSTLLDEATLLGHNFTVLAKPVPPTDFLEQMAQLLA